MHRLDVMVFTHMYAHTHTHTHMHAYIFVKIAKMNSKDLKTHKYVKISKSNFFHDYNTFLTDNMFGKQKGLYFLRPFIMKPTKLF